MGDIAFPESNNMAVEAQFDARRRSSASSSNTNDFISRTGPGRPSAGNGSPKVVPSSNGQQTSRRGSSASASTSAPGALGRPRTASSETSSVRSVKSASSVNGHIYGHLGGIGEESSYMSDHLPRTSKIVPLAARPGTAEDLSSFEYELVVRQQPKQARICTGNDRLPKGPIDPPPVVRLQISRSNQQSLGQAGLRPPNTAGSDASTRSSLDGSLPPSISRPENRSQLTSASLIQSPYLFCFAALCKAEEDEELYLLPDEKTRYVTGNVVSSLYHLKDPSDGSAEGFFVFPDIGVRVEGTFRLKLSLYEMVDATVHHCKTVYTEPFQVYSPKRFPGVQDSTELSKSFATQGLKMRIKGGPARTGGKPLDANSRLSQSTKPGSSGGLGPGKRPRTPQDIDYAYLDDANKRRAIGSSPQGGNAQDLYRPFHYYPRQGGPTSEPSYNAESSQHPSRPSSSSYSHSREHLETPAKPISINARECFRNQFYPPRTAVAATSNLGRSGVTNLYGPSTGLGSLQRPTTAPAVPSPRLLPTAHPSLSGPTYRPYDHRESLAHRPASPEIHRMPPRDFPPSRLVPQYSSAGAREGYSPCATPTTTSSHHYTHALADPRTVQDSMHSVRSRPATSGAQRITLPSLSEMIRRPDLDPRPGTSSFSYLALPSSSLMTHRESDIRSSTEHRIDINREADPRSYSQAYPPPGRGSPAPSDDFDPQSEEDKRYYEIRARQMLHRRPSAPDDA